MKYTYKYILLSILALGALSCNKSEIEEVKSNDISFEVFTGAAANSEAATKGERYNSETDFAGQTFGLYAWNSSVSDTQVYENEPVSKTGGKWVPATSKKWEDRDSYVFEAVYPQPTSSLGSVGLTAFTPSTNPANLTFSYTIPTTTGDAGDAVDKDFMLAYYSGKGNEGKAPLTFTHPLTCVNFKAGTMTGISTINSITIEGVYASGSCTVRLATYTYNSTDRQCYSYEADDAQHTSLWTPSGSTSVKGVSSITASTITKDTWAYNFLLIPQNTATKSVKLLINITTSAGNTFNISTTINSDYWRAGYTNTYIINYSSGEELVLDPVHVTPWDTVSENMMLSETYNVIAEPVSKDVTYSGGNFQIKVTSYSTHNNGVDNLDEPWTLEYSETGEDGTWSSTRPEMITSDVSGNGSSSAIVKDIPVAAQTGIDVANINFEETHTAALKAAEAKTDYDLSLYNPATGQYGVVRNTANCYVINAAGSYKFPLVYGNAIKDGATNNIAYNPGKTGSSSEPAQPLLPTFVNCKDKSITSPYIKDDIDALTGSDAISGNYSAVLLWQDVNGLISLSGFGVSGDYITFQVSENNIHQGNAIIALKKGDTIVWSWHIWVTDEDLSKDNLFVTSASATYSFMSVNLGQTDTGSVSGVKQYGKRSYFIRVVQTSSNKCSDAIEIIQSEYISGGSRTNSSTSTTYQWGRKDALFCNNVATYDINGNAVTAYSGIDGRFTVFNKTIGNLIQNPTTGYYAGSEQLGPVLTNYHNLWNNGVINGQNHIYDIPVVKTIYDPCPVGYYVPSIMAFRGLTSDGSGYNWGWSYTMSDGSSLFMPANGYRLPWQDSGFAWYLNGESGQYLSSTTSGSDNYGIGVVCSFELKRDASANPDAKVERSYGASIRPVKE